jgi:MMP 1-O-methyltransferase
VAAVGCHHHEHDNIHPGGRHHHCPHGHHSWWRDSHCRAVRAGLQRRPREYLDLRHAVDLDAEHCPPVIHDQSATHHRKANDHEEVDGRDRLQDGWRPPVLRAEVLSAEARAGKTTIRCPNHQEEIQNVTNDDRSALAVADAAKGFMPADEALGLRMAAAAAPNGVMLEVGSYCGKSAVHLGIVARQRRTMLFSVDHHRGSEENQAGWEWHDTEVVDARVSKMDTLPFFRATIHDAGLEGTVVAVVGESAKVGRAWQTPLAFCFIDGGHGRAVAHADFDAWVGHVQPGGLLAIHDVFPNPADGGRPPYELYLRALGSGFEPLSDLAVGSLRILRRQP